MTSAIALSHELSIDPEVIAGADARCFGETVYEREDGWSPVSDAVAVLDAAGLERPVVVACSMGGQTAIESHPYQPRPGGGLVLIAAAICGAPYPDLQEGPTAELNAGIEEPSPAGDASEVARLEAGCGSTAPAQRRDASAGPRVELFLEDEPLSN